MKNVVIERIRPEKGDILVVRVGGQPSGRDLRRIWDTTNRLFKKHGVAIIVMPKAVKMSLLDEKQMKRIGWLRAEDKGNIS